MKQNAISEVRVCRAVERFFQGFRQTLLYIGFLLVPPDLSNRICLTVNLFYNNQNQLVE